LGPLEYARPFMAPLYACAAAVGHFGRKGLPWSVRFLMLFLADQFNEERRAVVIHPVVRVVGEAFRADAKAEGTEVVVGGWECLAGTPPARARWFSVNLCRRTAAWAFSRGEPFRCIAALELYATLLCVKLFGDRWGCSDRGSITLSGTTDNLGNTFTVAKLMSSKFPAVVILAELSEQRRTRGMELDLVWAPRDQNEEADSLTNRHFTDFDPSLRIAVNPGEIQWLVLDKVMAVAEDLYRQVQEEKAANVPSVGKTKKGRRFREQNPW